MKYQPLLHQNFKHIFTDILFFLRSYWYTALHGARSSVKSTIRKTSRCLGGGSVATRAAGGMSAFHRHQGEIVRGYLQRKTQGNQ